jgi:membrane-associated phospholipid phosphatase
MRNPIQCLKPLVLVTIFFNGLIVNAQRSDSLHVNHKLNFTWRQTWPIMGLVTAGLLANGKSPESIKYKVAKERNEHMESFHTKMDNFLQYSPLVIAYGLDAAGVKSKTDIINRSVILIKTGIIVYSTVNLLKSATKTLRPDKSSFKSFPSGHTAQAFATATFLSEEYKDRFKWMPYLAYGIASGVGACRIANNRHFISDVLVGAGIGILSTKVSYWTHQYKWNKKRTTITVY